LPVVKQKKFFSVRVETMNMNIKTGSRIKSLRIEKGLNQGELGKMLGLDQGTVSKMERGENDPTAKTLRLLRKIFGVTIDWILTGQGLKQPLPLDIEDEMKEIIDDFNTNETFKIKVLSFCYDYKAKNLSEFIKKKKYRTGRLKIGR
jgi:transcriptional regulator with XRE-family HTH domain